MPCHTKFTHGVSCRAKFYEKFFFLQTFCPYASGFCAGFVDNPFKKTYNNILEYFSRKHPKCGTEAAYLTCIIFRRGERTALPCKEVMEEKNMKKATIRDVAKAAGGFAVHGVPCAQQQWLCGRRRPPPRGRSHGSAALFAQRYCSVSFQKPFAHDSA